MRSTQEQILIAAETLFSAKGYAATGVREITRLAGTNVASVHYYFGSKEELYLHMIRRHTEPLNAHRLRLLAAALAKEPLVDAGPIFAALIDPVRNFLTRPDGIPDEGRVRLAGRVFVDISTSVEGYQERLFSAVKKPFWAALHQVVPDMPEPVLESRFYLAIATLMGTVVMLAEAVVHADPPMDAARFQAAFESVKAFVTAGFHAPFEMHKGRLFESR